MLQKFKDPEVIVKELTDLNIEDRFRFEKCLTALSYCGFELDELKSELFLRILRGTRRCPINVSSVAFAVQTAKSIAHQANKQKIIENDIIVSFESEDEYPSSNLSDPEKLLISRQEREKLKRNIIEQFADCSDSLTYINKRLDGGSKSAIMDEMNIDDMQFETKRKKVMRRLKKLEGKTKHGKTGIKKQN